MEGSGAYAKLALTGSPDRIASLKPMGAKTCAATRITAVASEVYDIMATQRLTPCLRPAAASVRSSEGSSVEPTILDTTDLKDSKLNTIALRLYAPRALPSHCGVFRI